MRYRGKKSKLSERTLGSMQERLENPLLTSSVQWTLTVDANSIERLESGSKVFKQCVQLCTISRRKSPDEVDHSRWRSCCFQADRPFASKTFLWRFIRFACIQVEELSTLFLLSFYKLFSRVITNRFARRLDEFYYRPHTHSMADQTEDRQVQSAPVSSIRGLSEGL